MSIVLCAKGAISFHLHRGCLGGAPLPPLQLSVGAAGQCTREVAVSAVAGDNTTVASTATMSRSQLLLQRLEAMRVAVHACYEYFEAFLIISRAQTYAQTHLNPCALAST